MTQDYQRQIDDLANNSRGVESLVTEIEDMASGQLPKSESKINRARLTEYLTKAANERTRDFPAAHYAELVERSKILSIHVREYISRDREKISSEIAKDNIRRLAELKYMWRLWGERLVRWVLGAVVTVLLYSLLVAVSKWTDGAIVIPGKDFIRAAKTAPKTEVPALITAPNDQKRKVNPTPDTK